MCCRFPLEKPGCMLFWKLGLLWGWCLMFHFIVAPSAHWGGRGPLEGSAPSHPAQSGVNVSLDQAFPIQVLKKKKKKNLQGWSFCNLPEIPVALQVFLSHISRFETLCVHLPWTFWATFLCFMSLLALLCIFQLLLCAITLLVLLSTLM